MANTIVIFETIRVRSATTFDGTFQTLGNELNLPLFMMKITNNSNRDCDVSFDGSNQHDIVPAGSFALYDFQTNKQKDNWQFPGHTQVYIRAPGGAGTGNIYLIAIRDGS